MKGLVSLKDIINSKNLDKRYKNYFELHIESTTTEIVEGESDERITVEVSRISITFN